MSQPYDAQQPGPPPGAGPYPQQPYPQQPMPPQNMPPAGMPHAGQWAPQPVYAPPARPRKTSTTGPKILTVFGVLGILVAVVTGALGIMEINRLSSDFLTPGARGSIALDRSAGDTLTFDAEGGTAYVLVAIDRYDVRPSSVTVTVDGGDGQPVGVNRPFATTTVSMGDTTVTQLATFTTPSTGQYQVTVDGQGNAEIAVISKAESDALWRGLVTSVILIVVAVLSGVFGAGLTIAGGIWWGARSKNARLAAGQAFI